MVATHRARVVVAPDKFKGSCSAAAAAAALIAGLRDVWRDAPDYVALPMADGGEGTVATFLQSGADARTIAVRGPLGEPVQATYARAGDVAIIEMAAASGLALASGRRDVRRATSYGTGELLRDALDAGAKQIILGIGGSATSGGGAGALAALGARFYDAGGAELAPDPVSLARLARVDIAGLDPRLQAASIAVACDVDNPLLGPQGAAAVYGPQKGADDDDVAFLEGVLARLADAGAAATGRDLRDVPGAGAAGGLGWALATFAGARLAPGFDLIAEERRLPDYLAGATLCITGEGRIDAQTLRGKVVDGVAALARPLGIPVIAFGGSIERAAEPALWKRGIGCVAIVDAPMPLTDAMRDAPVLLRYAAARFARLRAPI
ncbi:MAG: glycerate kinase [Candidatus Velthaea sp.]